MGTVGSFAGVIGFGVVLWEAVAELDGAAPADALAGALGAVETLWSARGSG